MEQLDFASSKVTLTLSRFFADLQNATHFRILTQHFGIKEKFLKKEISKKNNFAMISVNNRCKHIGICCAQDLPFISEKLEMGLDLNSENVIFAPEALGIKEEILKFRRVPIEIFTKLDEIREELEAKKNGEIAEKPKPITKRDIKRLQKAKARKAMQERQEANLAKQN